MKRTLGNGKFGGVNYRVILIRFEFENFDTVRRIASATYGWSLPVVKNSFVLPRTPIQNRAPRRCPNNESIMMHGKAARNWENSQKV